ncbi:hypothetical protein [Haloarchaeobius baliensis]|uniref:hypothetical protein n=1 Tax=Haloarchaeobius baliensis TaxID=1670458 RepID=UPI003F880552
MAENETDDHQFDYATHWVSEQCAGGVLGFDTGPLLTGILKFGTPWNVITAIYLWTSWGALSAGFLFASFLGQVWINVSPFLIWYYDERVIPEFFAKFRDIYSDEAHLSAVSRRYNEFYADYRLSIGILWAVLLLVGGWAGTPVLLEQGMDAYGRLFLYLTYLWAVYIGLVLAEPGFKGPVTTILLMREVSDLEFDIQPLHPDQLGGLSTVGYFSIRTTLVFSSASLFIPLSLQFSAGSGSELLVFFVTGVYVLTLLLTFIYPTYRINRAAATVRDAKLSELQSRIDALKAGARGGADDELSELNRRLQIREVRETNTDYQKVRLYPIQIDILLQLAGSLLLPIGIFLLETYLKNSVF